MTKKNLAFERYRFFTWQQSTHEKIEQHAADLKNRASFYDFGYLKGSLIKDMIIYALQNETIRETLLQDDQMDSDGANKFCVMMEQQVNVISQEFSSFSSVEVQSIRKSSNHQFSNKPNETNSFGSERGLSKNNGICYQCGGVHGRNQSLALGKKCNKCGNLNHFYKIWRQKNVNTVNLSENYQTERGYL